eukprot:g4248.t1
MGREEAQAPGRSSAGSSDMSSSVAPPQVCPDRATDINGCDFDASLLIQEGAIVVYTAASHRNFAQLQRFVHPFVHSMMRTHRHLRCVVVAVADLRVVPQQGRGYVLPILKKLDGRNAADAINSFAKTAARDSAGSCTPGTVPAFCGFDFVFLPDFSPSGALLRGAGCGGALADGAWRVVVTVGGFAVGTVSGKMPQREQRIAMASAWEAALKAAPRARVPWPVEPPAGSPGPVATCAGSCLLAKRGAACVRLTVRAAACVGWELRVAPPHQSVVLSILAVAPAPPAGGDTAGEAGSSVDAPHAAFGPAVHVAPGAAMCGAAPERVYPARKFVCSAACPARVRTVLRAGTYELRLANDSPFRAKNVHYALFATPAMAPEPLPRKGLSFRCDVVQYVAACMR